VIARSILVLLLATATSGVAEPKRNPYLTAPPMSRARSQATPRPAPQIAVAASKALVEAPARRRENPYAARRPAKR
jgi:hypothetical protein